MKNQILNLLLTLICLFYIVDLINYFDNRVIELKKEYNANTVRKEMWLGDSFIKVLTTLKE